MNTVECENSEKSTMRTQLGAALEKAKNACERLKAKSAATGHAADKAVREHPYEAVGIAFGVGLLIGAMAIWSRRK
jgi:ElaB/YqjD/DUF883 family membrane-anchored ribosome-binding protein